MRIQFCGADRTVTGSCHLIEINGRTPTGGDRPLRLLLDAGMYQGQRDEARRINAYLPDGVADIDVIILSHGHLDHCGKLPVVVRAGYKGPIYCTPATAEVARIVLMDAARIQQEDADYLNRRSRPPGEPAAQPLFTEADARSVLALFRRVPYDRPTELQPGITFTFRDAGHILGSAYIVIETREGRLLFTADVGRYGTPILRDPAPIPGAFDVVITESTYGNRKHAPMDGVEAEFLDAVKWCVERRSRMIVPSFAVGRTQTVLWYMQKFVSQGKIPAIPIYVDSPMGVEVSKVHQNFRENYDEQTSQLIGSKDLFGLARITFASTTQESKAINSTQGACVIIASSPTCEFGRVLHHLINSVERGNDLVVFVGWIPPGTLGRRLQQGAKRVRILDRYYDLKCQVRTIHGLSAHADGDELLRFLAPTLKPQTTSYVVHGEPDQAEAFAARMLSAGLGRAVIPAMESSAVSGQVPVVEPRADQVIHSDE